jgi:hypothetical protein
VRRGGVGCGGAGWMAQQGHIREQGVHDQLRNPCSRSNRSDIVLTGSPAGRQPRTPLDAGDRETLQQTQSPCGPPPVRNIVGGAGPGAREAFKGYSHSRALRAWRLTPRRAPAAGGGQAGSSFPLPHVLARVPPGAAAGAAAAAPAGAAAAAADVRGAAAAAKAGAGTACGSAMAPAASAQAGATSAAKAAAGPPGQALACLMARAAAQGAPRAAPPAAAVGRRLAAAAASSSMVNAVAGRRAAQQQAPPAEAPANVSASDAEALRAAVAAALGKGGLVSETMLLPGWGGLGRRGAAVWKGRDGRAEAAGAAAGPARLVVCRRPRPLGYSRVSSRQPNHLDADQVHWFWL